MEIEAKILEFPEHGCNRCSKILGLYALINRGVDIDGYWVHDLDAFQMQKFKFPECSTLGICTYGFRNTRKKHYNSGSIFYTEDASDIISAIARYILAHPGLKREEAAIDDLFNKPEYRKKITVLDHRYNVGYTNFKIRYEMSEKPIHIVHFHPENLQQWRYFMDGENEIGYRIHSERLLKKIDQRFKKYHRKNKSLHYILNPFWQLQTDRDEILLINNSQHLEYRLTGIKNNVNYESLLSYLKDLSEGLEIDSKHLESLELKKLLESLMRHGVVVEYEI